MPVTRLGKKTCLRNRSIKNSFRREIEAHNNSYSWKKFLIVTKLFECYQILIYNTNQNFYEYYFAYIFVGLARPFLLFHIAWSCQRRFFANLMVPDVYYAIFGRKKITMLLSCIKKSCCMKEFLLNLKYTITAYLHLYIFRKFETNSGNA